MSETQDIRDDLQSKAEQLEVNEYKKLLQHCKRLEADLKKTQRAKVAAEKIIEMLEEVLKQIPANVYWKDLNGTYQGFSRSMLETNLFGKPGRIDWFGKKLSDILESTAFDSESVEQLERNDNRVMALGSMQEYEEAVVLSDKMKGQHRPSFFLSRKAPLYDKNNQIAGMVGVSIDITDRKEIERNLLLEKEKSELKSQMRASYILNMKHDLLTPCHGILGFIYMLLNKENSPSVVENLTCIADAGERILALIDEIMKTVHTDDFSAYMGKENKSFNPKTLIESGIRLLKPIAKQKGIEIHYTIDPALDGKIEFNEFLFEKVFNNLLSNAVKFTHEGEISIDLLVITKEESGYTKDYLSLTIHDTGVGIEEQLHDYIFGKFCRVHKSSEGKYHGSGLGLSIVKDMVKQCGGEIELDSKPGEGSTFLCRMPFDQKTSSFVSYEHEQAPEEPDYEIDFSINKSSPVQQKVLIVEDEKISQRFATALFGESGWKVEVASTAKEAYDYFSTITFDLIVVDIGLPDKNGFEVVGDIQSFAHNKNTYVVALTAHAPEDCIVRAKKIGFDEVLFKPIKVRDVKRLISYR
jgi:two-component system, OmpR family, aerobic respiration control sensor histidine kinase ArcB